MKAGDLSPPRLPVESVHRVFESHADETPCPQDVRGEALVGLAPRGEHGIVDVLITQLTPECHLYELDAAEALADPRLVEPLQARSRSTPPSWTAIWQAHLDEALAACSDQSVPVDTERSNAS
nr:hypothetical protein [uncultured Roseateles sp.]